MKRLLKGGSAILTVLVLCHCGDVKAPLIPLDAPDKDANTGTDGTVDSSGIDDAGGPPGTNLSCGPIQDVPTFPSFPGLNGKKVSDFYDTTICDSGALASLDPNGTWHLDHPANADYDLTIDFDCQNGMSHQGMSNLSTDFNMGSIHSGPVGTPDAIMYVDYTFRSVAPQDPGTHTYSAVIVCNGTGTTLTGKRVSFSRRGSQSTFQQSSSGPITFDLM